LPAGRWHGPGGALLGRQRWDGKRDGGEGRVRRLRRRTRNACLATQAGTHSKQAKRLHEKK